MVRDVGLEDKDVIVFHVVDAQKLKFTHFKADGLSCVKNKFYVEMLFPENANLVIYTFTTYDKEPTDLFIDDCIYYLFSGCRKSL